MLHVAIGRRFGLYDLAGDLGCYPFWGGSSVLLSHGLLLLPLCVRVCLCVCVCMFY